MLQVSLMDRNMVLSVLDELYRRAKEESRTRFGNQTGYVEMRLIQEIQDRLFLR